MTTTLGMTKEPYFINIDNIADFRYPDRCRAHFIDASKC